jgi:hypothetical protein
MLDGLPSPGLRFPYASSTAGKETRPGCGCGTLFAADGFLKEKNAVRRDWLTMPPRSCGG